MPLLQEPPPAPAALECADLVRAAVERGLPGVVLLVDDGSGVVWEGAAGSGDLARGTPASSAEAYHLASIGKLYTAATVLMLADGGRLALDEPAQRVLGAEAMACLPHAAQITIRQLLDHTSGLYAFNNDARYLRTLVGVDAHLELTWTPEDLIALACEQPPLGAPGAAAHYSDTNYVLLGLLVERVTGQALRLFEREALFRPLGLEHTWFYGEHFREETPVPLARGYLRVSPELTRVVALDPAFERLPGGLLDTTWAGERLDASAGIVATLEDLHRFAVALFRGELLSPASRAWLLSVGEGASSWALGAERQAVLRAFRTDAGVLLTANGDGPGVNTALAFEPQSGAILIAFTNLFGRFDENEILREQLFAGVLERLARRR